MPDARRVYARMRSILEVPILNEKYWAKVPAAPADAIMLDLEDSATPANKETARDRIVAALADGEYFGGRTIIVRCNNLATPWGADDLAALARAQGEFLVCYPKLETADEVREVRARLAEGGVERGLHIMIETARGLIELDRIATCDGVVGLHHGYVDFAADVGSRAFEGNRLYAPVNDYVRAKIAIAAAAYGLFATGGSMIPEYRDLEQVRAFVAMWADLGYTACIAVSPAHLPIINEVMAPSAVEVERARRVCASYESVLERGEPAAVVDGRVITMPDYRVAQLVLARALPEHAGVE
jgi:citrate lyase beta subunit